MNEIKRLDLYGDLLGDNLIPRGILLRKDIQKGVGFKKIIEKGLRS